MSDLIPQKLKEFERRNVLGELILIRIFTVDIPYNLRLREDVYHLKHENVLFSFDLKRIRTDNYSDEEPYDEPSFGAEMHSSTMKGFGSEPMTPVLGNIDPKTKSYEHKYIRAKVFALDLEDKIGSSELVIEAINELIRSYSIFCRDPVPAQIKSKDVPIIFEHLIDLNSRKITPRIISTIDSNLRPALRLTKDSNEEFQKHLGKTSLESNELLHKALHLNLNGYHSAAVIYLEKSMDCFLDELMDENIDKEKEEILSYIGRKDLRSHKMKIKVLGAILGYKLTELTEYIRYKEFRSNHRNDLVHSSHEIDPDTAQDYLDHAIELQKALSVIGFSKEDLSYGKEVEFERYNGEKIDLDRKEPSEEDYLNGLSKLEWERNE